MNLFKMPASLSLLAAAGLLSAGHLAADTDGKRVAVLVGPTQDAFVGTWVSTFEGVASDMGMEVSVFSTPFDPALQARQMDDAVAEGFDALVLQAVSQNAIVPSLNRAHEAGLPVLSVMAPLDDDVEQLFVSYVGEDSTSLGALAGEAMADALSARGLSRGRVAAITGALAEGIAPIRLAGFEQSLQDRLPDVEIVAIEDVKWNPVEGEKAAGQLLARFAGDGGLDGMYGMNDRLGNAIVQAALTAGIAVGGEDGMIVVGGNCQAPGIQNVMSGDMVATVEMLPAVSATKAAEVLADVLDGKTVDRTYFETHEIVTSENIADYAEACSY